MTTAVKHPPGRAGRLLLRRRLVTAELGRDQLSRKLRVLVSAQEQLRAQQAACQDTWSTALVVARRWELRAGMLGGQAAYTSAGPAELASVELRWTTTAGVHHPVEARRVGPALELQAPAANAAVVLATEAFGNALVAGAQLAAAEEAVRRVDTQVALTRRRVRALEKRWLPALREALARVEQSLELAEQEEGSRLRRALDAGDARPVTPKHEP